MQVQVQVSVSWSGQIYMTINYIVVGAELVKVLLKFQLHKKTAKVGSTQTFMVPGYLERQGVGRERAFCFAITNGISSGQHASNWSMWLLQGNTWESTNSNIGRWQCPSSWRKVITPPYPAL